jgi:outer membrane protein OmpA-like peptidoglycan-associated protein
MNRPDMPAARPLAAILLAAALLAACANPPGGGSAADAPGAAAAPATAAAAPAPAPAPTPAPAPPPPVQPFDDAVQSAANNLLGKAQLPADVPRHSIVIDPLIDGVTGAQTNASVAMGARIAALIKERYPQYEVLPFTAANVAKSPLVLVGTFTGVNGERKTEGEREAFRICLALADLKTGKLVGKGLAFSRPDGVDPMPTAFFRDAPAWAEDPATLGYIRTCQGTRIGDPIHPLYVDRIASAAVVSEAIDAYAAGRYQQALSLYQTALTTPSGKQLRVYSGLYLSNWRLGRRDAAAEAFGLIVDHGFETRRLGVKFLFRPGSTAFLADTGPASPPYGIWLKTLATQTSRKQACLEVVGHSSATGPAALNDRLSQLRAEYVRDQLDKSAPGVGKRMIATGAGSRETMVGNKRDDASDALDRRVEFKLINC